MRQLWGVFIMVAVSVLALILTMLAIGMIVTLIVFIYQLSQGRIL